MLKSLKKYIKGEDEDAKDRPTSYRHGKKPQGTVPKTAPPNSRKIAPDGPGDALPGALEGNRGYLDNKIQEEQSREDFFKDQEREIAERIAACQKWEKDMEEWENSLKRRELEIEEEG